ncbi:hypothetical protein HYH03_008568 [Edaphochlamys debaryana]|uniref:Uncharacterized protein n=1 Tax=Edaphochlamys debaryana TaxID=47281 RepID=A0A835Y8U5_9CHLO|nr:hypothetical protein HYH03_008568 [Edaphochlamys debaryana]|eukprot:KAG2493144.1 hypothetical protein HYH03_008568 [Edaphochlamys debaryana]
MAALDSRRSSSVVFQWYQQHKMLVWGSAAAVTAYAAYRAMSADDADSGCEEPQVSRAACRQSRQQTGFQRLRSTIQNYSSAASTLAETAAIVSADIRTFLTSDQEELPQSLRQLNKLLQSRELQETVMTVTSSVVRGVAAATVGGDGQAMAGPPGPPLVNTVIEAVLSERGRGLVGMAVGVATRNATVAVCEFLERRMDAAASGTAGGLPGGIGVKDVLDLLTSENGEKLLTLLLTKSIRTAVTSYVDATTGYNMYDDVLASIAKQEHRDALTDILTRMTASFCREAVVSYRKATAPSAANRAPGTSCSLSGSIREVASTSTSACPSSDAHAHIPVAATAGEAAAALAVVKCNGQAASGSTVLHGRPSVSAAIVKQQQAQALLAQQGGFSRPQAPPPWLRQVVELVRERDVRSLAVDVVSTASREATRGAVEGLLQGAGSCGAGLSGLSGALVLPPGLSAYKLYMMASLAVSLCMYAISPRVLVV